MPTRTDVHSPANLVTEDYTYVAAFDLDMPGVFVNVDREWLAEIQNNLRKSPVGQRGMRQCHHCGARLRYTAILHHVPSGANIAVGETCLENRFEQATADFHRMRKAAELDRAQQRIKTAAIEFLTGVPTEVANAMQKDTDLSDLGLTGYGLGTISDIRRKLWLYGNLSEGQVRLVAKLIAEIPVRAAQAQQRAAEEALKVPAQSGKVSVAGTVVSRKLKESEYGCTWKLTVKIPQGEGFWLGWISEPSKFEVKRGDKIAFTATFTVSDSDPSFAFGKRPSKFQIVEQAATEAAEDESLPNSLD